MQVTTCRRPWDQRAILSTLAGIQAAKRTAELIPLCHWVPLAGVDMTFDAREDFSIEVRARVRDLLDAPRQQVAIA